MQAVKLPILIRNLLTQPQEGWRQVASGINRRRGILIYLLPASLLIGLASFLGSLAAQAVDFREDTLYLGLSGLISTFILFMEVYVSGWLITELALFYNSKARSSEIFKLVIFSHTPFYVTLFIWHLLPQLYFLNLFGLWSFVLFWIGIPVLAEIPERVKIRFFVIALIIMLAVYSLFTFIFNSIYEVVINQFSTFAG